MKIYVQILSIKNRKKEIVCECQPIFVIIYIMEHPGYIYTL